LIKTPFGTVAQARIEGLSLVMRDPDIKKYKISILDV
jgi:hypothetical protein